MQGSQYFAQQARNDPIKGVIVLDCIAYNHNSSNTVTICRPDKADGTSATSKAEAELSSALEQAYKTYTSLKVKTTDEDKDSDPISFFEVGLPAVLVVEEIGSKDGFPLNPYYHKAGDFYLKADGDPQQVNGKNYLDAEYARQMIGGAVAWAATKAGLATKED